MCKKRKVYIFLTLILFAVEVFIGIFVHDSIVRPHGGDMLVVILIYCLIRSIFPTGIRPLPAYIFIFAVGVEVLQYFQIADKLGFVGNSIARTAIGSVFDWGDIAAYALGCGLICVVESKMKKRDCIEQ